MVQKHGPWTIQERDFKYNNSFINVREDKVLQPDGQSGTYSTVIMKPAVAILPIDSEHRVYLVQQFRYALGQETIEVVAGTIEDNEAPLEAAQREIKEELGIQSNEWSNLGFFDLDTSIVQCPVHLFLAKQLTFQEANQEGTETIKGVQIPFETAVQMVMDSKITHGPSCVLILKARNVLINQGAK
jgi:8-oxo-dGTP pyrophosphatase MutT (NUDIX family)